MFCRSGLKAASRGIRSFSSSTSSMAERLRIGYVPEHFSTPLAFAQQHFSLNADLVSEPLGTGALASRLKTHTPDKQLDIAVGLTEGFVADLSKAHSAGDDPGYGLVATYVQSPLCWAISTGARRDELQGVGDLKGKRVGVSRIGSGSYVMSYVLADQNGWLKPSSNEDPFEIKPIGDFAALRDSVQPGAEADFFMWEHFTTKKFWDEGILKKIGEIYTPWPSWMITARHSVPKEQLKEVLEKINRGVKHYKENPDEAISYITGNMHYSKADAQEWMKTVTFPDDVTGVEDKVVGDTVSVLQKAGVLKEDAGDSGHMISIPR